MKKFLALALSCSLALTILAGCGGGDTSSTPAPEDTTPAETTGGGENTVYIGVFEPATGYSGAGG